MESVLCSGHDVRVSPNKITLVKVSHTPHQGSNWIFNMTKPFEQIAGGSSSLVFFRNHKL
jgi:hypothetical protein